MRGTSCVAGVCLGRIAKLRAFALGSLEQRKIAKLVNYRNGESYFDGWLIEVTPSSVGRPVWIILHLESLREAVSLPESPFYSNSSS